MMVRHPTVLYGLKLCRCYVGVMQVLVLPVVALAQWSSLGGGRQAHEGGLEVVYRGMSRALYELLGAWRSPCRRR